MALVAACGFVAGLAVSRLLFEGLFPAGGWLGRPAGALALGLAGAAVAWFAGRRLNDKGFVVLLPLLLNLIWLLDPAVDLARGRFLFAASGWLVAVLWVYGRLGEGDRRWRRVGPLLVAAALLPIYLATMSPAVGAADTFEFQVVAPQLGIAHPTGYPLYLLLGKLFSMLPLGTVAWRLNLASAVYAVAAAAVVFRIGLELLRRPLPALLGATALGFSPIFWSQAIVAEVYALHALIVAVALRMMVELTAGRRRGDSRRPTADRRKTVVALVFLIGLGLTNHLTTVFLIPPAALAVALRLLRDKEEGQRLVVQPIMRFLPAALAFLIPLLLYLYLPLRWQAVNDEPMGTARFVDWVIAGRFQGALQWGAWLRDPARWSIIGRLLYDAWGWVYLALAVVGLGWLFVRQWRAALVLLVAAVGFTFYALNYYVPDLAVFLIPTHVVIAIWLAIGAAALSGRRETADYTDFTDSEVSSADFVDKNDLLILRNLRIDPRFVFLLAMLPVLTAVGGRATGVATSAVDQSVRDGGEPWARGVLALPLARGAAVLADSEKIAPLYYMQQIEGLRPDLEIMVLPDEAAYRAELDAGLAAGQAVYLARYLPGLAGVYHLRSAGPLVEVSREPLTELPAASTPADMNAGPLRLLGYAVEPISAVDANAAGLTLYWTVAQPLAEGEETPAIYLRWAGGAPVVAGRHPAGDSYPVNAWRPGEIVPDFHLLPLPYVACDADECAATIEVAVAPRFTAAADLAWQPVATVSVGPRPGPVGTPRRALFDGFALDGIDFPASARPGAALPLRYSGYGDDETLTFLVAPVHALDSLVIPAAGAPASRVEAGASAAFAAAVAPATETGPHALVGYAKDDLASVCGWLRRPTTGCVVAEIAISGAPLPEGAANFGDQIALLGVELEEAALVPGGQLPVTLTWQGLAEMSADYTVFVQVLDAADRIVGQVDAWPVQGTRPTSTWQPGEVIRDPYMVQLSPDLPPGDYRVIVGLYLLATGQRLPVVDEAGNAVDDKVIIGLTAD